MYDNVHKHVGSVFLRFFIKCNTLELVMPPIPLLQFFIPTCLLYNQYTNLDSNKYYNNML